MKTVRVQLTELNACSEAVDWAEKFDTLEEAWEVCERGDWMLWLAAKKQMDRKKIVSAACECARLSLQYTDDPRVLACIETTERWTRDEATLDEVEAAAGAAWAAAWASRAAARAAWAAAWAAEAAGAAAGAAARAAEAAGAAAGAAARASRAATLKTCAIIVRKHLVV